MSAKERPIVSGAEWAVVFYLTLGYNSERLEDYHFQDETNRKVFREIRRRQLHGRPVNIPALRDHFQNEIGASYFARLGDGVLISKSYAEDHFREHVNTVLLDGQAKELRRIAEARTDPAAMIAELRGALDNFEIESGARLQDLTLAATAREFEDFAEKKRSGKFWGHDIPSLPGLTRALNGLRDIVIIAAKPKVGKSTLALQIAGDVADQGAGVLYYDFENGRLNLMAREISRRCGIKFSELYTDAERGPVEGGILRLEALPNFAILNDRRLSPDRIRAHIRQLTLTLGREDILIIVDSLQKLPMQNLSERRAAVDGWLRAFEALKADFPLISIVLISELSREGGKPKESGSIEYSGNFLFELETGRSEEELKRSGDDGLRKLWLRYARDVGLRSAPIELDFHAHYYKFKEIDSAFGGTG